jgi:glycosyltransferase involved in cell wall biosynthesis
LVQEELSFFSRLFNKISRSISPAKPSNSLIKISAVIPTYNTNPKALERLVKSLDQQTLSKQEYEVIFVDDGSTDNTFNRLKRLAASRPHFTVKQIENSGWGSRPRNVGTKMARGVYILYLDHDDTVFPEAFERVYNYGVEHEADVVNAKEIRTNGWSWGWDQFKENNPHAEKIGIGSLLPMTPHKFYKRVFLHENEIEFNEGARVLWEDVYFNTKVFTCNPRVAILADYPCYHWIETGENNSKSFGRNPNEKWKMIRNLMEFFIETIKNEEDLTFMLTHWYRTRVLGILGTWLLDKNENRIATEFGYAQKLAEDLIPLSIDKTLSSINQVRAFLLRHGNIDALRQLAQHERGVTARSHATAIKWESGKLEITTKADLTYDEKLPYMLHEENGQVLRYIPLDLQDDIPKELLDVKNELDKARYLANIKGRYSRVTWEIPVKSTLSHHTLHGSEIVPRGELRATIDILKGAMGQKLDKEPWEIASRLEIFGGIHHRAIVAPKDFRSGALIEGTSAIVYCNKSDLLSLDIGSKIHSVVGVASPEDHHVSLSNKGEMTLLTLTLPGIHTYGETNMKGEIYLQPVNENGKKLQEPALTVPAYLIGDQEGTRIEAKVKLPSGFYQLSTRFENRTTETGLIVRNQSYQETHGSTKQKELTH